MAITNGYATVAELQRKLGRTVSAQDTIYSFLEECIERASRAIDIATGRIYYSKTITSEVFDINYPSDSGLICVDIETIAFPAPIITLTSLVEDGVTLTENTDFYVYKGVGYVSKPGGFTSTRRGLSVTATFGEASTPKNVNAWCLMIAGALSGRETSTYTDSEGGIQEVIRNSVPKWVYDEMRANRRFISC